MMVIKPLYGVSEAGTHWWVTYFNHHREKLGMTTSTYDPCLLITLSSRFGIVGMQTDDIIILCDEEFGRMEDDELQKVKFMAKPKEKLTPENPMIFNGYILTRKASRIILRQKHQGKKIQPVTSM